MSRGVAVLSALLLAACGSVPARRTIECDRAPKPIGPYSQAIQLGDVLYLSGQIGIDTATGSLVAGGVREETRRALASLEAVLREAGFDAADVVSTTVYLADLGEFAAMNEVYAESFRSSPPARATVGVAALPKGARVEISAVAVRGR